MSIGYRIYQNDHHCDQDILDELKEIPVANIGDASSRIVCLDAQIHTMNGKKMIGRAYTVKVPAGDNLLFYYAIDQAQKGDIIVVDGEGYENRALCGGIMSHYAMKRKLGGFLIYGAIRDKKEIQEMDFPVFAKCVNPNGPYKNGPGEINVPVVIGGKVIHPGDIILGDEDGIAVIQPKDLQEVMIQTKKIIEKESLMMKQINERSAMDLQWVYDKINHSECEIIKGENDER